MLNLINLNKRIQKASPLIRMRAAVFLAGVVLAVSPVHAKSPESGPVVEHYGPVFAVPEGSFNLKPDQHYKIIMDVGDGPNKHSEINRGIESAARFLNMSVRNGIKAENLELAIVLHGGAAQAALSDQAHEQHFSVGNPNRGLVAELLNAGVDVFLCGQSAAYRGYRSDDLLPGVRVAVSAMTVHVRLQQEGYQAILF